MNFDELLTAAEDAEDDKKGSGQTYALLAVAHALNKIADYIPGGLLNQSNQK